MHRGWNQNKNELMKALLKEIRHNPLLWLLAFVPVVLIAQKSKPEAHTLLFVLSVLAIVPLAALLSHATESVAAKIGDALGHPNYVPNYLKEGKLSEKVPFVTNAASMKYTHIPDIGGRDPAWRQTSYLATHCAEDVPEGDLSLSLVYAVHPPLYEALNDDVKFAIRFHDGAYGIARRKLVNNETPLQMILHFADMWSSKAGHKPE